MKKLGKKYLLFFCLIFLAAISRFVDFSYKNNDKSEVIFLDVGQGDAILIQKKDFQILIDGGDGERLQSELSNFMPLGDRKIELVILTHPDEDHMGGLLKLLSNYQIGEIVESGVYCEKDICEKWQKLKEENNIPVIYAKFGQEILMNDIRISVLYPFERLEDVKISDLNDSSLVTKVEIKDKIFLLMGDSSQAVEEKLLENNIDIRSDVIKISHHGSNGSSSFDFLTGVSPKEAVISVGENSYGHPATELLNRLYNMDIEVFRTDQGGSIIFEF